MLGWIFPSSDSESRAVPPVVRIPCQVFTTQREWETRADSCTGERITISAAIAASVRLCSHSESSLLLLIVNDFFKCEAGALAFPPCAFPPHSKMLSQKLGFRRGLAWMLWEWGSVPGHERVPSTVQTFNLQHDFDRGLTCDGEHEEHAWLASCDAKNMESVVCQKELIKV